MDSYVEYIVKRTPRPLDRLIQIAMIFSSIVFSIVIFMLTPLMGSFGNFSLLLIVGVFYGAWYINSSLHIEYEYIFTNGEIDVDKIVARKRRKRLITVKCKDVQQAGCYHKAEHEGKKYDARLVVSGGDGEGDWYFVVGHPSLGKLLFIFSPSERMEQEMRLFLSKQVMINDSGRN